MWMSDRERENCPHFAPKHTSHKRLRWHTHFDAATSTTAAAAASFGRLRQRWQTKQRHSELDWRASLSLSLPLSRSLAPRCKALLQGALNATSDRQKHQAAQMHAHKHKRQHVYTVGFIYSHV